MIYIKDMEHEIMRYEKDLEKITIELEKLKKSVPEGAQLRAAKHRNTYQYFIRKHGSEKTGTYIKKSERKKAEILAQIEYDEKLKKILKEAIGHLKKMKSSIVENPYVYAKELMSPGKWEIIRSPYITDEEFLKNWIDQEYSGVDYKDGYPEYYTRCGLRVRSKSEVIIADILDEMKVPFLYEKPLKLRHGVVHPDFTLLDLKNRREIYWEHFGMMDDMDYRNNAFLKIRNYEESGFYQHDVLIWTFETEKYPINTREVRNMIKSLKITLGY